MMLCFNSIVVRLKGYEPKKQARFFDMFQFHSGTIKRNKG